MLAAALFGLSAPIAKRLLNDASPQVLAGLLYLGAAIALYAWRALQPITREASLSRADLPALSGVVVMGGVLGPLLMLVGLERVSGVTGSLLLNLEGPFTIGLAVLVFREHIGRYGLIAASLIFAGAALLKLEQGSVHLDPWGATALTGACLSWAIDNNLTQRLSLRDPVAVVRIKALTAGSFNLALGLLIAHELPALPVIGAALILGAVSYGLSVVLDACALRLVGSAREAMYFATAPFVGALAATVVLGELLRPVDLAAMLVMALGVLALLRERHAHVHAHEALEHDHLHTHDAHHVHAHDGSPAPTEPHSHSHRHVALVHDHPHVPDSHHRHRH